jgi:hypothetical protein
VHGSDHIRWSIRAGSGRPVAPGPNSRRDFGPVTPPALKFRLLSDTAGLK